MIQNKQPDKILFRRFQCHDGWVVAEGKCIDKHPPSGKVPRIPGRLEQVQAKVFDVATRAVALRIP